VTKEFVLKHFIASMIYFYFAQLTIKKLQNSNIAENNNKNQNEN